VRVPAVAPIVTSAGFKSLHEKDTYGGARLAGLAWIQNPLPERASRFKSGDRYCVDGNGLIETRKGCPVS